MDSAIYGISIRETNCAIQCIVLSTFRTTGTCFISSTLLRVDQMGGGPGNEGGAGADPGGGCRGCAPPRMTCGRFLINTVQSLDRHTKSVLSFDMYSQQFTLCYFLVKSPLLQFVFAFKIFYVMGQLVVHPVLRKILDPPLWS